MHVGKSWLLSAILAVECDDDYDYIESTVFTCLVLFVMQLVPYEMIFLLLHHLDILCADAFIKNVKILGQYKTPNPDHKIEWSSL